MASLGRIGALFLGSTACAPSVTTLVARGQFDAAICAADDDADQRRAATAYARAHALRFRAHDATRDAGLAEDPFFASNALVVLDSRFDNHGSGEMSVRVAGAS